MAGELISGVVPPYYRKIYDILFPTPDCYVDQDMFQKVMTSSKLGPDCLATIWELLNCKTSPIKRISLYKALALIALAQQGKQLSDKILDSFVAQELPIPDLGDVTQFHNLAMKVRRERDPARLGVSYRDLCCVDFIKIELLPEKQGLILKHKEYEVTSLKHRCTVRRRYNDFIALHELLMIKFPYRMVPRLPPKKLVGANARFIEKRRKALIRFLTLVVRHPALGEDKIVKFFLTYNGAEVQHKIREQFRNIPDEFLISDVANKNGLVPQDGRLQLATSKEQILFIQRSLINLEEIVSRMVARSQAYASDLSDIKNELGTLSKDPHITSTWATGHCNTWNYVRAGFRDLYQEFDRMSDKVAVQASMQEEEVVQQLNLLLDLLASYQLLCERHEKGMIQDQQNVTSKVGSIRKRVQQAAVRGADATAKDDIESRIVEQENHIQILERRHQFALHCIHLETQLVHISLEILVQIFQSMSFVFATSHAELSKVWESICPVVEKILPANHKVTGVGSASDVCRPTSPASSDSPSF